MPPGRKIKHIKRGQSLLNAKADEIEAWAEAAQMIHNITATPPLRVKLSKNGIQLSIAKVPVPRIIKQPPPEPTNAFVIVREVPGSDAPFLKVERVEPQLVADEVKMIPDGSPEDMQTWPGSYGRHYALFVEVGNVNTATTILPAMKLHGVWYVVQQFRFDVDATPFDIRESDCIRGRP